jgi:hypothetical protein
MSPFASIDGSGATKYGVSGNGVLASSRLMKKSTDE